MNAQPRDKHAMHAVVTTTTLPCASRRSPGRCNNPSIRAPEDPQADTMDTTQTIPQAGSHTAAPQAIACPAAHPAALPTVHPPISMTDPNTNIPPSSMPKMASMWCLQTGLKPHFTLKVSFLQKVHLMVKCYFIPNSSSLSKQNPANDHQNRPCCSDHHHPPKQVPEALPPQNK